MTPQILATVQVSFPPAERPKAYGAYGAMNGLGAAAAPIIGGLLVGNDVLGLAWRSVFWINVWPGWSFAMTAVAVPVLAAFAWHQASHGFSALEVGLTFMAWPIGLATTSSLAEELHGQGVVAGPAGRGDRGVEQLGQPVPGRTPAVRHLRPQPQRRGQQVRLLGLGREPARGLGGSQQRRQRLGRLARLLPVEGDLSAAPVGRGQPGVGLQGLGHGPVQPGPFHRQQAVEHRLADQRMPEGVPVPIGHQDLGVDRAPDTGEELRLGQPGDGGQEPVPDRLATHSPGMVRRRVSTPTRAAIWRIAEVTGASGSPWTPSSTQVVRSTRAPVASSRSATCSTRWVLPTPASPPTTTNRGSPPSARPTASSIASSCSRRPTRPRAPASRPTRPGLTAALLTP
jgi:hypothetical protein